MGQTDNGNSQLGEGKRLAQKKKWAQKKTSTQDETGLKRTGTSSTGVWDETKRGRRYWVNKVRGKLTQQKNNSQKPYCRNDKQGEGRDGEKRRPHRKGS